MTDVEIAGVGLHRFGRFEQRSLVDLGVAAVRGALAEAGLTGASGPGGSGSGGFQAAFCGTAYGGVATGHRVLGALGLTGGPIIDIEAGCASGAAAVAMAAGAIRAGQYDTVLVFGVEKMPRGMIRSSFFEPWQEEAGLNPAPAYFALRAQRLMREAGLTKTDLARLVVKNRAQGALNPDAMFTTPVTEDEVLASRLICEPLHLFMLCAPNEGAAAVVLRRAVGRRRNHVYVEAAALRSHHPGSVLDESTPMAGLVDDTDITPPTTLAARDAYEAAGLGPGDLDVVECQDTDAARELLTWAELGLCEMGDQARLLFEGEMAVGGRLPVNPSGGLLSKGEPLGASAVGQVVELTRQLQGEAGPRRVEGARVGLAHTIGRGANASAVILSR